MKNTRLYLDNWNYNAAIILNELENIVLQNGGAIVSTWKTGDRDTYTITNRSIQAAIREKEELIERLKNKGYTADTLRQELEELKAIPNDPITLHYGDFNYICFTIGNDYYYYSMDRNPLFDFHYGKQPINEGKISRGYYLRGDSKQWLYDCFLSFRCNHDERREAAQTIFNMLLDSQYGSRYRDKRAPETLNVLVGEKTWLQVTTLDAMQPGNRYL